jgi:hypothetical protein
MKPQKKYFQQKMRKMHPSLQPQVKDELNKLLSTKIIFLLRHTWGIDNHVPVRNNNGEIRIFIDFRNFKKTLRKTTI